MAVTIASEQRIGTRALRVTYSSDQSSPTFYCYRNGKLVATTQGEEFTFHFGDDDILMYQILDDASASPTEVHPGNVRVSWRAVSTADYYLVQEYVSSVWTTRDRIRHDSNRSCYTWLSRWLEDVTTHQFRVIPVGTNGNQGTAASLSVFMVRNPDPPNLSTSYDEPTKTITFSAAS